LKSVSVENFPNREKGLINDLEQLIDEVIAPNKAYL